MSSVIGKLTWLSVKKKSQQLLVLTERKTRTEKILLIDGKSSAAVVTAFDALEKRYGTMFKAMFKTITVDNGGEFSDYIGIEKSLYNGSRTSLYYCHPFSSWERGSNENQNKLIRRHFPKGMDFNMITAADVSKVEKWINSYPRKTFNFLTAEKKYKEAVKNLEFCNNSP